MIGSKTLWAAALALCSLAAMAPALAQGKKIPAAIVAVVDVNRVFRESEVGKDVQRQLDEYSRNIQAERKRLEEQLGKERDELKRQQSVLAPDAFAAKARDFETRVGEAQKLTQGRQQQFDRVTNNALNQMKQAMVPIFSDLAKEQGFNLMIEKAFTVFATDTVEVTNQVLQRLNRAMPKLAVPPPGAQ